MIDFLFTKTPLVFFIQNFWRDEAFSYVLAQKSLIDIIKFTVEDFSPPLYYILLHIWMRIFGTSEVMLRSLSFIFFIGTVYVVYEILRNVFKINKARSLVYLLLFVLNPFIIFYAFEARMYMMITFFITLSYYAFWRKNQKLYVISMVAALYTQYFALFILAAQGIEYLLREFNLTKIKSITVNKIKSQIIHEINNTNFGIKTFILSFIVFIPWLIYFLTTHDFSDKSFWVIQPPLKDIFYIPFVLYSGYERVFGEYYHTAPGYTGFHRYLLVLLATILTFPIFQYFIQHKTIRRSKDVNPLLPSLLLWTFFTPVVLFTLSFILQPFFHPRYFIFTSIGFLLLVVYAFEQYIQPKKSSLFKFSGMILFVLLIVMTFKFNTLNIKYRSKRNVSKMALEIQTRMSPKDSIFVTSELDYHLYQYYLKRNDIKLYNMNYDEIPQYVGKVLIPEDSLDNSIPVYPNKAFFIYYNSYKIESLY